VLAGWNNFRSMVSGYEIQKTGNSEQVTADAGSGEHADVVSEAG